MTAYDLRQCAIADVRKLFKLYHGYGDCGRVAVYAFAVFERGEPVAGFVWQPPPPGAAQAVAPTAPHGVLSLSRMVAVPRQDRELNHISRPLRQQMRRMIDRSRWPALVTYSDEGQGHTGHVYKCSGWRKTERRRVPVHTDSDGIRRSRYSAGRNVSASLRHCGYTWIQRWEHHIASDPLEHMDRAGWRRVPVGGVWASGNPKMGVVRAGMEQCELFGT